jgi:hypothetical protein
MTNNTRNIILILILITISFSNRESTQRNHKKIRQILNKVYVNDQLYRSDYRDHKIYLQTELDKENIKIVSKIIDSLGWLSRKEVGDFANRALFLTIQHSNKTTMEKYLPILKEAVRNKKATGQELALLTDRVELLNNRPQIYGTQINGEDNRIEVHNLIDPKNVNIRRKEMGMESIEKYLKRFEK